MHRSFEVNEHGRDFVIGDIHGMFDELIETLDSVNFNFDTDRLFVTGDLVDRGPKSLEVLRLLDKPWFFSIYGNHEDMMNSAINYGVNRDWIMNGGRWFGNLDILEQDEAIAIFNSHFSDRTGPYFFTIQGKRKKYGMSHACVPLIVDDWNTIVNNEMHPDYIVDTIWSRTQVRKGMIREIDNIDYIFHGHTPLKKKLTLGRTMYIDTGACYEDGFFTILELE